MILRGFIPQPVVERWREQFWSAMVGERGKPETWDPERNWRAAGYGAAELRLEPRRADAFVVTNILPVDDANAPPPPPRPG